MFLALTESSAWMSRPSPLAGPGVAGLGTHLDAATWARGLFAGISSLASHFTVLWGHFIKLTAIVMVYMFVPQFDFGALAC